MREAAAREAAAADIAADDAKAATAAATAKVVTTTSDLARSRAVLAASSPSDLHDREMQRAIRMSLVGALYC
jgi:hypothetical protein